MACRMSCLVTAMALFVLAAGSLPPQAQGPVFVQEPPPALDFSNSTGGLLSCQAQGSPAPETRWLDASYKELRHLSRLREVLANGSLFFPPFAADDYNPQVHASSYYCRAANPAGSIVSLESRVRAVVWQPYQPQVDNVFVMRGNVAVLTCGVPVFAREFVAVTGWQRDERPRGRTTLHPGGRYSMTSSGSLHVHDTVSSDTFDQFYCWVADKLTGERRLSLPGQIVVTDPEGEIPPRIEHSIPNVHVKAGDTADLVCIAKGNPPPSYRWYREVSGVLQEVQPSSVLVWPVQSVLQFPRAQPEDAARYVCSAGSALGEDRREVALAVSAPLSARVRPHQQVVDVGAAASFRCHVSGGGARVSWLRNGRPVAEGERTSLLQGAQMLVVHSVRKEDRGMYQCVARGEEESAQASAQLALGAVAPEMLSSFVEQTLQPGPPVTLRCVASGSPPPQFSWALDGAPLPPRGYLAGSFVHAAGDVVSHLNISSVRVQHGGLYTCLARNILGAAHHSAPLNVYGPPTARPPQNITAAAGADAYLRCPVAGYPISSVAWRRAHEVLPAHPRQRVFPNGTLGVRRADGAADRGEYRCTATNPQGEVAQGRIHLNIMNPPEIAPFQFPSNLKEGMRVLLSCSIISGDFPITISWRKDGGPLPQDLDIQEKHEEFGSTLVFRNMAAKHSGHYTCIASNAAASTNYTAKLTIRVPPAWVLEPQDVSALFQHPASLHCQASGFPTPTITWLRGKGDEANEYMRLESGSKLILYGNGTVLIRAVDPSHEGHYTCQASNGIGSGLSKAIFLQVNVPAHFKLRTANQSGVVGDSVLLTCEAEGDLPLRVSWSGPHRPSGAAGGRGRATERHTHLGVTAELRLESLARGDAGAYRCSAANNFGQDEMVVYLAIKEPPDAPHGARIQEVGSRWVSVAWGGPVPALHYVVQYRAGEDAPWNNVTVDGGSRTVRLGGLRPAATYLVRVLAVNDVGAGPAGEVLRVTTLQEAPSGPPTDVFAKAVTPRSIIVQWKPPVTTVLHSKVLGYKVGYREVSGGAHRTRTVRGGGGRLEVTLAALRQYARYEITVRAFNMVGSGPTSPPLLVTTLEGVPDKPPKDVHCTALSSQSIRVRWEPPPPDHRNGVIEGYKVLYRHISSKQGAQHTLEVKKTTNLETNLHGLAKHGNYSVRVLAYTGAGEGSRSSQVHCVTEEDVPGPPEFVKALVMTSDSILVSWTPPAEPNGHLLKYTVYIHSVQNGNQDVQKEVVFGDGELMLEARQMKEHHRYEFRVTAATGAGEGPSSVRVAQTPTSRVPARIASFSRAVAVGAGRSAVLACRAVGLPAPARTWRGPGGGPLAARHEVLAGQRLALAPLRPGDAGNYSCLAENVFGRDEVTYALAVLVPPGPPALSVAGAAADSLTLVWRVTSTGGSPITGYVLKHKQERGDWQSLLIDADYSAFTLQGIRCGCSHQLSLSAANAMGTGKPSAVVSAATTGAAPKVPLEEDFLAVNSTSATLYLEAWPDGGCPIRFFALEYRPWGSSDWTRLPRRTARDELTITDLRPATWYALKVAAHNDAGYSQQEFVFATRTQAGDTVMPYVVPNMSEQQTFIYSHLNIIIPVLSGIVCTVAISVCVCIAVNRSQALPVHIYLHVKHRHIGLLAWMCIRLRSVEQSHLATHLHSWTDETLHTQGDQLLASDWRDISDSNSVGSYNCVKDADPGNEAKSLAELENQRNSKQQGQDCNHSGQLYLPSPTRKGDSSLSYQKGSDTSGQDYEIGPYATFSLPCKNSGASAAGMQTMDYCVQFQTFNQQECYAGQTRPGPSGRFGKEYYSCSQGRSSSGDKLLRSANSPPDGLSLEISCISSQQTLPLPVPAKAGGAAPCQSRSHGCDPTDSDSSGQDKGRAPVCRHRTPRHTPHSGSGFELDSSTESAEASPDMKHHTRRRAPQRETSFRRKEVRRGDLIQC